MAAEIIYKKKTSIEHRKRYAQFFTPEPVAQIMAAWLLENSQLKTVLEPAFGLGIFSRFLMSKNPNIQIKGFDVDPKILNTAKQIFLNINNIELLLEDYLFNDWENKYDGIICNPPYFKFHDYKSKETLLEISKRLNVKLSGFTNIYTLFLLKSIYQLNENGRLAYIVPSEFLNSDYGTHIKNYLLQSKTLRHIIIVDFKENVFNDALTTSAILLLAKDKHTDKLHISNIQNIKELQIIEDFVNKYPKLNNQKAFDIGNIDPDTKWRVYYQNQASARYKHLIKFSEVAKVTRGIATGANEYFSFNVEKAKKYGVDEDYLLPVITKSKNIEKSFFTTDDFEKLKERNANIYLLDADKKEQSPAIKKYIALGEKNEIHKKYLTSKRNPWYRLEKRPAPPIWVGVFNRSGLKFIRNETQVKNLTTFHCIYLSEGLFNTIDIDLLFAYLLTPTAHEILNDNRREYGDGLNKFEPNDLNKASVLDLSKLNDEYKSEIMEFYRLYRQSVLLNKENKDYIQKIDEIIKKEYRI